VIVMGRLPLAVILGCSGLGLGGIGSAYALTVRECGAKFIAARDAGALGGIKWNDFRKTQCGEDHLQLPSAVPVAPAPKPAPGKIAAPAPLHHPRAKKPVTPAAVPSVPGAATEIAPEKPKPPTAKAERESSGTGFFVSAQGHVLTNAHVVEGCSSIEVPGPNGLTPVRVLAKDRTNDLALLKTDLAPPTIAQLRTGARLGEPVAAFGYPLLGVLSSTGNFTLGNVTSLTGLNDDTRYLQISAPIQPGNSGGPLLDASGNFVGVVSAKLNSLRVMVATEGDIPQNVNFAIKSSVAATFLESNSVGFSTGILGAVLAPTDLADRAKAVSLLVLCK
jgi:S1-C subfamily serine protease